MVEVHRKLYVRGDRGALESFIERLTARAGGEWRRDTAAEERMTGSSDSPMFCFVVDPDDEGTATAVILWMQEGGEISVSNVVAMANRDMGRAESNRAIERFHAFAQPAAAEAGVAIEMTGAHRGINQDLSAAAMQSLRTFSGAANKDTSLAHPNDFRRWMDFVTQAHIDQAQLEGETLARWLHGEGWDGERASELGARYDEERRLLAHYDQVR